jgi:hypothetical protein
MLLSCIRRDVARTATLPGFSAGFVTDDASKSAIYKLRYNVMVANTNQFPSNHYCIKPGKEFRDAYDDLPTTKHFLMKKNGLAVASCRLVCGRANSFEAEYYNWLDIRSHLKPTHKDVRNMVEPTRVVACKSVRGSFISVYMLTASLLQIHDDNYESLLGIVNSNATHLIKHYRHFMPNLNPISNEKFPVDEFIQGRHCNAFNLYIGTTQAERDAFVLRTLLPCVVSYKTMYLMGKK